MEKIKCYFWVGFGYVLNEVIIEVENSEDIEAVMAACIKKAPESLTFEEVNELTIQEIDEFDNSSSWLYVDLTPYNLQCYYILIDNFRMEVIKG